MIKAITLCYLKFPPLARNTIHFSLNGIMSYAGVDWFQSAPEDILLGCDEIVNKKLFV